MAKDEIDIEVVDAGVEPYRMLSVQVPNGATIDQVIAKSGILVSENKVGIFGELKSLDDTVEEGDRVEIYRPIQVDPMVERVKRVKALRKQKIRHRRS